MTQRLYEQNSYCKEFQATVLSCEKSEDGYLVVLDQTAFFPEGGGQAPDQGTLNEVSVEDVQIENGVIFHKTKAPFPIGQNVTGKINWELRFSRMQSHAGEHVLCGVVHSMFGYSNVGFHMSESVMTVDFSGPLSQKDLEEVELRSNLAIYQNVPITASYPTPEELSHMQYRSKIEAGEGLRLITIEGVDCCACCAPHPSRTGEIGLIKILSSCPRKKGTRIEMIAGIHAYLDYVQIERANKQLMGLLSAERLGIKEAVEKQMELISGLRSENHKLSRRLALQALHPIQVGNSVYAIGENLSYDDLLHCANTLLEKEIEICVLFSCVNQEEYLYVISSKTREIREHVKQINTILNGKGGGRPNYAQGKVFTSADRLTTFMQELFR